jgi:hypothetical protein
VELVEKEELSQLLSSKLDIELLSMSSFLKMLKERLNR